ncbi:MAG TPA: hypothetical protein VFO48_03125, partial [Vicinamibacterales bacterium]|nr:hypothetical protein [Vicinamibacterales bacterium]
SVLLTLAHVAPTYAAPAPGRFQKVLLASATSTHEEFDQFAARAKASGATHLDVTVDLPRSTWQYDTPGDPYPAWAVMFPSLWKVAPSPLVRPHVDAAYADRVLAEIEARCRILRRHGLKAYFSAGELHMMPERLFAAHPDWRGPRVDHPLRSRVPRFAPDMDHPEVLAQYRESVALLLRRCPEIELLLIWTNDSGSGLSWSDGLYSGRSGVSATRDKRMEDRLKDFSTALQKAAQGAGGSLEVALWSTRERDASRIARNLPAGVAIENFEGPAATPFKAPAPYFLWWWWEDFAYPVVGIPQPVAFVESLDAAAKSKAPRLVLGIDPSHRDLFLRIYERFWRAPSTDLASRLALLRSIAADESGPANADDLLEIWLGLDHAAELGRLVASGGQMLALGGVHQRWITRPLVPFPAELKPEEKDYYRRFQFQGRTDEEADDLVNLQGRRLVDGWSHRQMVEAIINRMNADVRDAQRRATTIAGRLEGAVRGPYELLATRLRALGLLLTNARNVVSYQAQLDRVRRLGLKPDPQPVNLSESTWDRQLMLQTAREELDTAIALLKLLRSTKEPILHVAPSPGDEEVTLLSPEIERHLERKIEVMNGHWEDYGKIFTHPFTTWQRKY